MSFCCNNDFAMKRGNGDKAWYSSSEDEADKVPRACFVKARIQYSAVTTFLSSQYKFLASKCFTQASAMCSTVSAEDSSDGRAHKILGFLSAG